MKSYIVSIDMGSSRTKIIIMKVLNDNISIENKFILDKDENCEKVIIKKFEELNIKKEEVETYVMTGGRSSFYDKIFLEKTITKIDEFDSIGMGAIVLSNFDEAITVNMGTGTAIVVSDINNTKYLSGTALGSGTFIGLVNRMNIKYEDIDDIFLKAEKGNIKNVDLNISDISKTDIGILSQDITSSNFGAFKKNASDNDITAGLLSMITQNIGIILKNVKENYLLKENKKNIDIIFTGSILKYPIVKKYLNFIENFTNEKYNFIDDEYTEYSVAIGAYENYLLKLRKNI